jgi:hypothetical protein
MHHWRAGYHDAVRTLRHPEVLARCESAYDLSPNRLPTVTLVGRPIN